LSILVEQGTDAVVVEPLGDVKKNGFYANLWGIPWYVSVCQGMPETKFRSFQALGCQGAPWTGQPQVRSKEGLDLRITESTGALGSSNFAYYRVMR